MNIYLAWSIVFIVVAVLSLFALSMAMAIASRKPAPGLKPVFTKQRHKCPFYGFHFAMGLFMDSQGNQCAMMNDSYSPCRMEIAAKTPAWEQCPLNNRGRRAIVQAMGDCQIFPDEFHPKGKSSWKGIKFKAWQDYVMGDNVPRPS